MDLLEDSFLSSRTILNLIDEYTLYVYYTGYDDLQLRTSYYSPYRGEGSPSFSVFESRYDKQEFCWKDNGDQKSGDIFDLLVLMFKLKNREEAFIKVNKDFDLGFGTREVKEEKIQLYDRPKFKKSSKIAIKARPFNKKELEFYSRLHIGQVQFDKYHVEVPSHIWYHRTDAGEEIPEIVNELCFSYRIGKYYQIYKPYNKIVKFRNDFPAKYVFGYIQLPRNGDILIIDKSFKDLMFCDVLGYDAVAPKSETTMIPDTIVQDLLKRFKRIYITFDNDNAGRQGTQKYLDLYPSFIPIFLEEAKDKTDLCLLKGFDYTKQLIKTLII